MHETTQEARTMSPLHRAHLLADHRLAEGDTSDLLPGIDPDRACRTARRLVASDYHEACPYCTGERDVVADTMRELGF